MTKRKPRTAVALPDVESDGRKRVARRFRALTEAFTADLGGKLSHADTALVRQAAAMVVRAEQAQAAMLMGEAIADEDLVRLSNAAARILNMLGAQRAKRKPHAPTLADIAAEIEKEDQAS